MAKRTNNEKTLSHREVVEELIERLRNVADGASPEELVHEGSYFFDHAANCGLCSLLGTWYVYGADKGELFSCWPRHSGYDLFPVPSPSTHKSREPGWAFNFLEKWKGEYGEDRRDLCAFVADELEEMIEEFLP